MDATAISIAPFKAEVENKNVGKPSTWEPCEVVGVNLGTNDARFVVIRENDGELWPAYADYVRKSL